MWLPFIVNSKWSKLRNLKIMLFLSLSLRITSCERNTDVKKIKACQNARNQINLNPGPKNPSSFLCVILVISHVFSHFEHHCHILGYLLHMSCPLFKIPAQPPARGLRLTISKEMLINRKARKSEGNSRSETMLNFIKMEMPNSTADFLLVL